ncbi:DUF1761 domain-containing protein [Dinoroseobacter sp. S76]|uniref:DUF1761 domain-containing protein n=1 Tax=Dinoroseobacter sp. S76 TaxID=3415124 RepID=UPI003C7985CB
MELISVVVAGVVAWMFGAVWYMTLGQRWMDAAQLTEEDTKATGPLPYIVSLITAILVAGMTRHIFASSGVDSLISGAVTGFGLGAFIAAPWIVNNILFSIRDKSLIWMDCGYPIGAMTLMGIVLSLL